MTEGRKIYWDYPDPFLPATEDPFSIFAMDEAGFQRSEHLGFTELARIGRQAALRSYRARMQEVGRQYLQEDPSRRLEPGFRRIYYPELTFWRSGAILNPLDPKEES